ncbi:MAG: MmgE/PrpD family protein [Pseudomonadota bacterium]
MSGGGVTGDLARWIARADDPPTPCAKRAAAQAVLDWTGVTLAAGADPMIAILISDKDDAGPVPVVGTGARQTARAAARAMGAASHLLDFDDINKRMRGHPTVAILPALLASAEERSGAAVIDALVTGTEVACMLGEILGADHYERGFHTTATVGTVAAAAGVCRMLGADVEATSRALSLAATQASGLRAMFGTMAKPLHAGLAAERGVMAAHWAMAGMTAPMDGIEAAQGLGPVLSDGFAPRPIRPDPTARFGIEDNVFKRHAACYYTHSAIMAATELARDHAIPVDDVESVAVGLQASLLSVCDIVEPKTGLEAKFSVRHLVAMALLGRDTTDHRAFTDALAAGPEIGALRQRITAEPFRTDNRMLARLRITRASGPAVEIERDVSQPATDLDAQETALLAKFYRLATPALGAATPKIAQRLLACEAEPSIASLLDALTPEATCP